MEVSVVRRWFRRPRRDPSSDDALTIDLYDDGGIRLSAPPPDERDRLLVPSSVIPGWMRSAAAHGWTVMVRGRPRSPLVAPVLKQIRDSRLKFVLIDTDPEPVGRRRPTKGFRRLSSLGTAARDGSGLAVSDMLERGADPEVGGPVWRRLRNRGEIRAAADYQRLTGVRSKNAPPDTANAVVVSLAPYRWALWVPAWMLAGIVGIATIAGEPPPLDVVIGVLIAGLALPITALAIMRSPRSTPVEVAVEGTSIWWRRFARRWEGPADLGHVRALGAAFETSSQKPFVIVVLVGDDFPHGRQRGVPRAMRRWVGDRGHVRLFIGGFVNNSALIREALLHVPADVETMPGTAEALARWGISPPG